MKLKRLDNEKGIALLMVLVLSAIALSIMGAMVYMITSGTQISGLQKRYATCLEAAKGSVGIANEYISEAHSSKFISAVATEMQNDVPSFAFSAFFSQTCLDDKINEYTTNWDPSCDKTTVDVAATYDFRFDIGTSYRVYGKVSGTTRGNTTGSENELEKGGVSTADKGFGGGGGSGELTVIPAPYQYSIELKTVNVNNPTENCGLSVLYQF